MNVQVDEVQMVPDGFGFHLQASEQRRMIGQAVEDLRGGEAVAFEELAAEIARCGLL